MSRISQTVATQIAQKLVSAKRTLISEAKKQFQEYCTEIAEKKVPKEVMEFFKKHSEYVKTTNSMRMDGKGISKLDVSFVRAIPSVSPNCYYQHVDLTEAEAVKVKKLYDAYMKMKQDTDALESEIDATLISLRTYANIEKELPEAAQHLPKVGLTVIVDTASLRKKLK